MLKIKTIEGKKPFLPTKSYLGDAGWDVRSLEEITLLKGQIHQFKLGFAIEGEIGKVYITEDRSSLALKGLIVSGKVIDNGYRGEVSVILTNIANACYKINIGDKIAQILIYNINDSNVLEVDGLLTASDLPIRESKAYGSSGI